MAITAFENFTRKYRHIFHPVMAFDTDTDRLLALDFTEQNTALTASVIENIDRFSRYINEQLQNANSQLAVGGYAEHRTIYNCSSLFDAAQPEEEPRRLHLGTDIWGPAGTPVYAFMDSTVHSFAFNDRYGDYGATIILQHQLEEITFYTLYGHLSLPDIQPIQEGQAIGKGTVFAHLGQPHENGHWPPHLHFQVILDIGNHKGDFPGVCKYSEREKYLANSPDPDGILQLNRYVGR